MKDTRKIITDRSLLVDGVQMARFRYEAVRDKYVANAATCEEFLNARDLLSEAEAALRAHEEVYGKDLDPTKS